jgi:GNAT superfamily N-acetyltransferase
MVFCLRKCTPEDRNLIIEFLNERWGSPLIALGNRLIDASALPAVTTEPVGQGLATFDLDEGQLISLDATVPGQGLGTALLEATAAEFRAAGHLEMRVTTTNDNLDALRFYQRRNFRLVAIKPDAVEAARRLKPTIPLVGAYGIPVRDEIVLVRSLV